MNQVRDFSDKRISSRCCFCGTDGSTGDHVLSEVSFDEYYRLFVSKAIKDHYADAAVTSCFINLEGQEISLHAMFLPSQALLAKHRALLAG